MKKQIVTLILYFLIGLPLGLLLGWIIFHVSVINPFLLVFIALGSALSGVVYLCWGYWVKKKRPEKFKQLEIEGNDERNIKLRDKAGFIAWIITYFTLTFFTLFLFILDYGAARWLSLAVLIIHFVSFLISKNAYSRKI